ncbi:class I SAM-dependent methyltransferase [Flavobacterium sp. MAH-1]|uniref:Class I SAM-dependent methyltransferase n=1 Tax=Flavobacterium agri TaxID=2743471 RepID=A0A7Y8Y4L1_9FLAO|nr:class I SAM-dependent methyltransferase [Flavobacterium agri]NUY81171.1 class I SAM-dependent methyltransferase [Flavobacterium agri]NYA71195.1 class I SAM-dependent methyltransferase [Flavobacterium agri]
MKDNFSAQATKYAQNRPQYPQALIDYIASFAQERGKALDLATGNGQVAHKLASKFETVFATDISQKQLDQAEKASNIIYKLERAEQTSFEDNTFDLITVAQAVHWFDFTVFYKEIYRILKPEGVFAILGYGLFSTNERADAIISHFYRDIIGPYWDAERRYVEENYQTIPFPFKEIETITWTNDFEWTTGQLLGYLESWSATQHYKSKTGINPVDLVRGELSLVWEASDKKVHFPLLLRVGRPYTKF